MVLGLGWGIWDLGIRDKVYMEYVRILEGCRGLYRIGRPEK